MKNILFRNVSPVLIGKRTVSRSLHLSIFKDIYICYFINAEKEMALYTFLLQPIFIYIQKMFARVHTILATRIHNFKNLYYID